MTSHDDVTSARSCAAWGGAARGTTLRRPRIAACRPCVASPGRTRACDAIACGRRGRTSCGSWCCTWRTSSAPDSATGKTSPAARRHQPRRPPPPQSPQLPPPPIRRGSASCQWPGSALGRRTEEGYGGPSPSLEPDLHPHYDPRPFCCDYCCCCRCYCCCCWVR